MSTIRIHLHPVEAQMLKEVQKVEVGAFYWTVLAPDIVNSGRVEQDSASV